MLNTGSGWLSPILHRCRDTRCWMVVGLRCQTFAWSQNNCKHTIWKQVQQILRVHRSLPELSFLEEFVVIVCDSQGVPRTDGKKCANKMCADSNWDMFWGAIHWGWTWSSDFVEHTMIWRLAKLCYAWFVPPALYASPLASISLHDVTYRFKLKTPQKDGTCSSDSLCWFIFSVLHGSLRLSTVSTNKKPGLASLNIWIWWQTCEWVRPPLFVIWICSERRTLHTHDVPSSVFNSQTTYMSINIFLLKLQVTGQGVHWERYTWAVRAYKEHGIRWCEESCRNILTKWRPISL